MKMHPGASELLAHTPRPGESQIEVLTRNLAAAKQVASLWNMGKVIHSGAVGD